MLESPIESGIFESQARRKVVNPGHWLQSFLFLLEIEESYNPSANTSCDALNCHFVAGNENPSGSRFKYAVKDNRITYAEVVQEVKRIGWCVRLRQTPKAAVGKIGRVLELVADPRLAE